MLASATNLPGGDAVARYVRTPGSPTNAPLRHARTIAGQARSIAPGWPAVARLGMNCRANWRASRSTGCSLFAAHRPASLMICLMSRPERSLLSLTTSAIWWPVSVQKTGTRGHQALPCGLARTLRPTADEGAPRGTDNPLSH